MGNGVETEIDSEDLPLLDGWKIKSGGSSGYAFGYAYGMSAPLARLILGLEKGDPRQADHIDPARRLDNRRSNLRIATVEQNKRNVRRKCTNRSGHKGVSWHHKKQKWNVSIVLNGKTKFLGWFPKDALELAAAVYEDAARTHYGEYARV